jgi:hypothetical protein
MEHYDYTNIIWIVLMLGTPLPTKVQWFIYGSSDYKATNGKHITDQWTVKVVEGSRDGIIWGITLRSAQRD